MTPDRQQCEKFIKALTGDVNTRVAFQVFDDDSERKDKDRARTIIATLDKAWRRLTKANNSGCGVFVTVNSIRGGRRLATHVDGLRALFVDCDTGDLPPLAMPADILVQSVNGQHAYWLLEENEPLEKFRDAQRSLAAALNTDPSITDLPRVMRLPGFFHCKGEPRPVTCEIHGTHLHTIEDILDAFPTPELPPGGNGIPTPPEEVDRLQAVAKCRNYLAQIEPAIEGQQGDNKTFRAATIGGDFGLTESEFFPLLLEWNDRCTPPWPVEELRRKMQNAYLYRQQAVGNKAPRIEARQLSMESDVARQDQPQQQIANVLQDVPAECAEHIVPRGFQIYDEGPRGSESIYRGRFDTNGKAYLEPVSRDPIVITAWCSNETTNRKSQEIAWKARGKWHRVIADLDAISDTGKLIAALRIWGFHVTSINKRNICMYLDEYFTANRNYIPTRKISEQMGWQSDGGFLAGQQQIQTSVQFAGADSGDLKLAEAVEQRGSQEEWAGAITTIAKYPRVIVALYASLAVPLLQILRAPSFALDWAGETSTGKTTALHVAASAWGSPDERSGHSMIHSWGGTQIGIERLAAVHSGLPLILDDTKRARIIRGRSIVADALYTITNGVSDTRGSKDGLRGARHWRTILLSTGESRIVDASKDGGTAARAICLWGPPFGDKTTAIHEMIVEIDNRLRDNYGHAGPKFVAWLLGNKSQWPAWQRQFVDLQRGCNTAGGVAARMSGYLAVLEMAARLAHRALDFPWPLVSPIQELASAVEDGADTADRAAEALNFLRDWATANAEQIDGTRESPYPPNEWLASWQKKRPLCIPGRNLAEVLQDGGFDNTATIRLWWDRGWLQGQGKKRTRAVRIGGNITRCYAVTPLASEESEDEG